MEIKDYFFKYLWVVTLLLIFGVCYFAAGTLNAYLASKYVLPAIQAPSAPAAPAGNAAANYHPDPGAVVKRNLFNIVIAVPDAGPGGGQPVAPTLHAKLLGVIYFAYGSVFNRATVRLLDDNKSMVFKEGDEVKEGSGMVVETIEEKLIRVRYPSGKEEELSMEEDEKKKLAAIPPGVYVPDVAKLPPSDKERALAEARKALGVDISNKIHKKSETEYVVEQSLIQDSLQNLNNLLQQARMVPNLVGEGENKTTDGFRIFRIQESSIFDQLGLHNGDVIKAINGVKMDNIERGLELLQQLRYQKAFTLTIGRQDQNLTVSYRVE